ncbi:DNA polymerase III subunit delta [Enterococcus gallinarum]|jgi:DNA polymerase-3 subunit delta|nr:DNA polymerase III subunit delta [Enterococcus casseliflavus]AMG51479.2 DNA polymerase III subunit delta [Enterococcus gallinarum]EPH60663.1 DNA polymerase III, delta subunit [Enterococcus faecium 13.SD.W.09]WEI90930.1 DNA polymerase III subunit delta [Enterococcus casseliflavus]
MKAGGTMELQKALQSIRTKELQSIYLVIGSEMFLQEQVRAAFLERFSVGKDDLNFASFDMEKDPLDMVIQEAQSLPFFGDQRLLFVERPFFLTAEKKSNAPEHDLDDFLNYIKDPLESSVMVIFADVDKLDERKKITKQLKKAAVVIDVAPMKEADVRQYLQQSLANDGIEMSREAFDLFLRLTDLQLSKAMQELQKLRLYAGNGNKITKEIVLQLIPKTLEHNVFELTSDVLKGNVSDALRLYDDLLLQGEETIKINAILISQVRLLLQAAILMKIGYQQANIAETLGIHPYRVKLAMQQARGFGEKQLAALYSELIENDYLVKSGQMDKEYLFQLFVLKHGKQ